MPLGASGLQTVIDSTSQFSYERTILLSTNLKPLLDNKVNSAVLFYFLSATLDPFAEFYSVASLLNRSSSWNMYLS